MPFINGRFYMNPAYGHVIENARASEAPPRPAAANQQRAVSRWVTINGRHVLIQAAQDEHAPDREGSSANLHRRAAIAAAAQKHDGDTSMPYKPGRPTCNLFVQKVIAESGAPKPVVTKADGSKSAPGAAEWAGSPISGWRILSPGETPQPGDVAARKENFSDATGHSGIVTSVSKNGVVTVIAAHSTSIGGDMTFAGPHTGGYNNVYRRYVGR